MAPERGSRLPDDFTLTDKMRADAAKLGIDYDVLWQLEGFIDHHTAEGTRSKSWEASWRTWCRNAVSWNKRGPRPASQAAPSKPDRKANPAAWAVAEKKRLEAGEWANHYERTLYTVPPTGADNLARELARLTGIITASEVAA